MEVEKWKNERSWRRVMDKEKAFHLVHFQWASTAIQLNEVFLVAKDMQVIVIDIHMYSINVNQCKAKCSRRPVGWTGADDRHRRYVRTAPDQTRLLSVVLCRCCYTSTTGIREYDFYRATLCVARSL